MHFKRIFMDVPPIINQPILENHHFREFLDMPHARCARSSLIVSDIVIFVNGFAVAFFGANFKKDNSCTGLRKLGFHGSTCFCMEVARIQPKDRFQTGDSLRVQRFTVWTQQGCLMAVEAAYWTNVSSIIQRSDRYLGGNPTSQHEAPNGPRI